MARLNGETHDSGAGTGSGRGLLGCLQLPLGGTAESALTVTGWTFEDSPSPWSFEAAFALPPGNSALVNACVKLTGCPEDKPCGLVTSSPSPTDTPSPSPTASDPATTVAVRLPSASCSRTPGDSVETVDILGAVSLAFLSYGMTQHMELTLVFTGLESDAVEWGRILLRAWSRAWPWSPRMPPIVVGRPAGGDGLDVRRPDTRCPGCSLALAFACTL